MNAQKNNVQKGSFAQSLAQVISDNNVAFTVPTYIQDANQACVPAGGDPESMSVDFEQQAVVDAPMVPLCILACAGSGKTKTAVHRLVQMRRNLGDSRGRVALLSFSNVAINTFREGHDELANGLPSGTGRSRVDIDTLDGHHHQHHPPRMAIGP